MLMLILMLIFNTTQLYFSENILFKIGFRRSLFKISNLVTPFISETVLSTLYCTIRPVILADFFLGGPGGHHRFEVGGRVARKEACASWGNLFFF